MKELIFEDNTGRQLNILKINRDSIFGDKGIKVVCIKVYDSVEFEDPNKVRLLAETLSKLADWMEKK